MARSGRTAGASGMMVVLRPMTMGSLGVQRPQIVGCACAVRDRVAGARQQPDPLRATERRAGRGTRADLAAPYSERHAVTAGVPRNPARDDG